MTGRRKKATVQWHDDVESTETFYDLHSWDIGDGGVVTLNYERGTEKISTVIMDAKRIDFEWEDE